jgi:thiol-disulfide isomerase/thioredoxin
MGINENVAVRCGRYARGFATPKPVEPKQRQFADLQTKYTGAYLLDVWASWCEPCRMVAPHSQAAAAKLDVDARSFKLVSDKTKEAVTRPPWFSRRWVSSQAPFSGEAFQRAGIACQL